VVARQKHPPTTYNLDVNENSILIKKAVFLFTALSIFLF
jgi:hypothetical protein